MATFADALQVSHAAFEANAPNHSKENIKECVIKAKNASILNLIVFQGHL